LEASKLFTLTRKNDTFVQLFPCFSFFLQYSTGTLGPESKLFPGPSQEWRFSNLLRSVLVAKQLVITQDFGYDISRLRQQQVSLVQSFIEALELQRYGLNRLRVESFNRMLKEFKAELSTHVLRVMKYSRWW
jgi:hypothetical protein